MRQETLQTLTLKTLATATQAANRAVKAGRAGGHRLVAVLDERLTAPVAVRTQRYVPRLADAMRRSSRKAGALADKGIDALGRGTDRVIEVAADQMVSQVKRVARMADGVSNPVLAKGLHTAARLSMPGARAALAVSTRVAAAADKLPLAASPKKAVRKAAGGTKAAAKPVKAAVTKAAKVVKEAAPAAAPVRRAAARPARAAKAPADAMVKAVAQARRRAAPATPAPQAEPATAEA